MNARAYINGGGPAAGAPVLPVNFMTVPPVNLNPWAPDPVAVQNVNDRMSSRVLRSGRTYRVS
jgi:hypothetical protein